VKALITKFYAAFFGEEKVSDKQIDYSHKRLMFIVTLLLFILFSTLIMLQIVNNLVVI